MITFSNIIKNRIPGMKLGVLETDRIRVIKDDDDFDVYYERLKKRLHEHFPEGRPSSSPTVGHVRRMYRKIGWEPTQYRPSSEALVRRMLKGKGLYRINNLVDYGNLVSAHYLLPMGLYDSAHIRGDILVDVGKADEYYDGISKPGIRAEGKMILRDEKGIFGNPTADSKRTSITSSTDSALALFFCPPELEDSYIDETLHALSMHYKKFSDGKTGFYIFKGG